MSVRRYYTRGRRAPAKWVRDRAYRRRGMGDWSFLQLGKVWKWFLPSRHSKKRGRS